MARQIKDWNHHSSITVTRKQFDYHMAGGFYGKPLSERTRRAYRRVIRELFTAHRVKHPSEITTTQMPA